MIPVLVLSVLLLTPTPTPIPTPTPTATSMPSNPSSSFQVDNSVAIPWPLPVLPTYPPLSPSPTLYNATPIHATDYPNAVATATAQIGSFTAPIDNMNTPVAAIIGSASTPNGSDYNTGIDFGGGSVSFSGFASDMADNIGPTVATGKAFVVAVSDFLSYAPWLQAIVTVQVTAMIIAAAIGLISLIIKAGQWIVNFFVRLFTLIGSWIPG